MAMTTMLDLAKANGNDAVAGLISDVHLSHPEVSGMVYRNVAGDMKEVKLRNVGWARTIKGLDYKTLVLTALPTVDFRSANEGADAVVAQFENRRVETHILDPRWEADKALAEKHEDGFEAYLALQAKPAMMAAMKRLGTQFYYGNQGNVNGSVKGHPGLIGSVAYTVDAGGTTDDVASSVYAVKFGVDAVCWVFGGEGQMELAPLRIGDAFDANNKKYTAYIGQLTCHPGLQIGSTKCVGRIKKLTTDNGKGLTDSLLSQLFAKFESGMMPDAFFASRRSIGQLQQSRTATNATGAEADWPTSWQGIPLVPTDSIYDTEKLAW